MPASSCRTRRPSGVVRIEADEERCRQLIEKSLAMCTALAPRIGYDIASAIAKTAYHENRTVREIVSELVGLDPDRRGSPAGPARPGGRDPGKGGFPSIDEMERLLDPYNQTIRGTGLQGGTSG